MRRAAVAALAASVVLGACGGRATSAVPATASPSGASTLAPSLPTTAPSRAEAPSPTMPTETQDLDFKLTSSEFAEGGSIPREFTCDADDTSPPLVWTGLPDGSAALALIVDDPDPAGSSTGSPTTSIPPSAASPPGPRRQPALHPRAGTASARPATADPARRAGRIATSSGCWPSISRRPSGAAPRTPTASSPRRTGTPWAKPSWYSVHPLGAVEGDRRQ